MATRTATYGHDDGFKNGDGHDGDNKDNSHEWMATSGRMATALLMERWLRS